MKVVVELMLQFVEADKMLKISETASGRVTGPGRNCKFKTQSNQPLLLGLNSQPHHRINFESFGSVLGNRESN